MKLLLDKYILHLLSDNRLGVNFSILHYLRPLGNRRVLPFPGPDPLSPQGKYYLKRRLQWLSRWKSELSLSPGIYAKSCCNVDCAAVSYRRPQGCFPIAVRFSEKLGDEFAL